MMASEVAERFMRTLQEAEQTGNVQPLVEMFSDDAELSRLSTRQQMRGKEGARQFWLEYISAFSRIQTEFTNVIETGEKAVLEWASNAEPGTAEPFRYEGVSILEIVNGQVSRFRTYYDSARFINKESEQSHR